MPTFSQIANDTAAVNIAWGSLTIHVDYYPSRITEKTIAEVQSFDSSDPVAGFGMLNDLIVSLVKSWDLMEDDDVTMYPINPDRLAALPILFRSQVITTIIRDLRPELAAPQA